MTKKAPAQDKDTEDDEVPWGPAQALKQLHLSVSGVAAVKKSKPSGIGDDGPSEKLRTCHLQS